MNNRLNHVLDFFKNQLPAHYGCLQPRYTQVQMAVSIAGMLSTHSKTNTLIVHAPVGTGKTFAALVPSLYDGKRLIYATSSLNLQAQLKNEELNYLHQHGLLRRYVVAKGISNYLCPKRIEQTLLEDELRKSLISFGFDALEGDRLEFEQHFGPILDNQWNRVKLQAHSECFSCKRKFTCPTGIHRSKFNRQGIDVVVTNHNQLLQSVINVTDGCSPIIDFRTSGGGIIIIDEAHDFQDAALDQLSKKLSTSILLNAINQVHNERTEAFRFFNILINSTKYLQQDLDITHGRLPIPEEGLKALNNLNLLFKKMLSQLVSARISENPMFRRSQTKSSLEQTADIIDKILDKENYTSWIELDQKSELEIIVVSNSFRRDIRFLIDSMGKYNKMVFMSGTLAVQGSFGSVFYDWGGPPSASDTLDLPTEFDYLNQSILYVPQHIPNPLDSTNKQYPDYCKILGDEIIKLIKATGGRTLILCTSHKQLELLHNQIKAHLDMMGITLLKQGAKSTELLSEDFKRDEMSVLIGSGTFFAGLSIPRKSLISVILCRLPFPAYNDPFIDLIAEDLSKSEIMNDILIPRMLIRLQQAGGRLIRTIEDFGCFTILDPRVCNRSYSEQVKKSLLSSGCRFTRNFAEVENFLVKRMNETGFAKYQAYTKDKLQIPYTLTIPDRPIERQDIKEKACRFETSKSITPEQLAYYEDAKQKAGIKSKKLRLFSEPYRLFAYLVKLDRDKNLNLNVPGTFPYANEQQEHNFIVRQKRSNRVDSSIKISWLSHEEIAAKYGTSINKHS
ncbi:DNA helicase, Rad3 [Desulfosporosinus orientis DSM 765]|uniref:DNA helicase, Rad3 n=1 Tax=Desulfosporosinus orientis (strain ATCC 19365 / DSM 765 / NCIMB 8382 / VKM B-1628 / Singapore I) TaxID=768706 RepID=G7WDQ7_DESOD|nr:ATP-dependent DNA helicase [Desulfosporosinus orientis]AET68382.1 DNA helicase, Rad3 [Desulfosporosinus orientis DSM 765]